MTCCGKKCGLKLSHPVMRRTRQSSPCMGASPPVAQRPPPAPLVEESTPARPLLMHAGNPSKLNVEPGHALRDRGSPLIDSSPVLFDQDYVAATGKIIKRVLSATVTDGYRFAPRAFLVNADYRRGNSIRSISYPSLETRRMSS